ncbi:hypothetical protein [Streptomyces clavuligerus]|uniref:Uncharacterized protein n=1 Tax=Streptomyces clavuligerus TaxID=1901 RepID=B5GV00_STRCL|nr:hypothetical protein [Streptomyces clavuligerus]ANW20540.1 hypothetical protein BB341_21165 [Streptomyces clavuligerus]AXU15166.1 hypothetical protein D1794_22030 [Streptomyces clavuligerus]EDY50146.1 AG1 protein [Streptomyces clavuligerus]EFG06470.1 Hypothetical protein SCLAV_1391 [Streptomyces clavuligerus]MBY6305234.1 hypothetical protein [Streptomyces clavuligerus]
MAWAEWERLKAEAVERRTTGMRLNEAADPGGGGGDPLVHVGDLRVDQKDLAAIGDAAFGLHQRLARDGRLAASSGSRAANDLSGQGFALGGALRTVTDRWEEQLTSLRDACAKISNHMEFSNQQHRGDDEFIKRHMSTIRTLDEGFDDTYGPAPAPPGRGAAGPGSGG